MSPVDDELLARFGELRATETAATPGMSAVLNRTRGESRSTSPRTSVFLLVGAAASIAAITLVVVRQVHVRPRSPQPSIVTWRSPTTGLIPTPVQAMLAPAPLLSSVLDGATSSTLWHKGD